MTYAKRRFFAALKNFRISSVLLLEVLLNCSRNASMSSSMSNSSVGMAMRTVFAGRLSGMAIPGVPKLRCHSAFPASLLASHSPIFRHRDTVRALIACSWSVTRAKSSMVSPEGTPFKSRMYSKTSTAASHSPSSTRRRASATNQLLVNTSDLLAPCSLPCAADPGRSRARAPTAACAPRQPARTCTRQGTCHP